MILENFSRQQDKTLKIWKFRQLLDGFDMYSDLKTSHQLSWYSILISNLKFHSMLLEWRGCSCRLDFSSVCFPLPSALDKVCPLTQGEIAWHNKSSSYSPFYLKRNDKKIGGCFFLSAYCRKALLNCIHFPGVPSANSFSDCPSHYDIITENYGIIYDIIVLHTIS